MQFEAIHITVSQALVEYFMYDGSNDDHVRYQLVHDALAETFPDLSTYDVFKLIKGMYEVEDDVPEPIYIDGVRIA